MQVLGHSLLGFDEETGTEARLIWLSVWIGVFSPTFPRQRRFGSLGWDVVGDKRSLGGK